MLQLVFKHQTTHIHITVFGWTALTDSLYKYKKECKIITIKLLLDKKDYVTNYK